MPEVPPSPTQAAPHVTVYGLSEIIRAVRERWLLVLICVIAAAAGAGLWSALSQSVYTAKAELLFRDPGLDDKVFGSTSAAGPRDLAREAETNTRLTTLDIINEKTATALRGRVTEDEVERSIKIDSDPKSDVVTIEATDADPKRAAEIANTFAREFIKFRRQADTEAILRTQRLVDKEIANLAPSAASGADGQRLKEQADRLSILASLQTGNAELVQPARPPQVASAPKPQRNIVLGTMFGLVLGVIAALVANRFDDRIKSPEDLEQLTGLPILTKIGRLPELSLRGMSPRAASNLTEAFSFLVARLRYFNVDREVKVVLITSPEAEAGKSTLSWHFAGAACTSSDVRVLLLEADLRRPVLANRYGLSDGPGLAEMLSDPRLELGDVVRQAEPEGERRFDVLPAGSPPPNPIELLQSARFKHLLDDARGTYDLICIDTAPVGLVADVFSLLESTDGVILVARVNQTKRSDVAKTVAEFQRSAAPILGVVANGVPSNAAGYGYSYDYGSLGSETKTTGSGSRT